MNDGPGIGARFEVIHDRLATADAARSEHLSRLCGLGVSIEEREARRAVLEAEALTAKQLRARVREVRRQRNLQRAEVTPYWPGWARPLSRVEDGHCAACGREIHPLNEGRMCGTCGQRAGRNAVRARLAIRLYLAGRA